MFSMWNRKTAENAPVYLPPVEESNWRRILFGVLLVPFGCVVPTDSFMRHDVQSTSIARLPAKKFKQLIVRMFFRVLVTGTYVMIRLTTEPHNQRWYADLGQSAVVVWVLAAVYQLSARPLSMDLRLSEDSSSAVNESDEDSIIHPADADTTFANDSDAMLVLEDELQKYRAKLNEERVTLGKSKFRSWLSLGTLFLSWLLHVFPHFFVTYTHVENCVKGKGCNKPYPPHDGDLFMVAKHDEYSYRIGPLMAEILARDYVVHSEPEIIIMIREFCRFLWLWMLAYDVFQYATAICVVFRRALLILTTFADQFPHKLATQTIEGTDIWLRERRQTFNRHVESWNTLKPAVKWIFFVQLVVLSEIVLIVTATKKAASFTLVQCIVIGCSLQCPSSRSLSGAPPFTMLWSAIGTA